MAELRKVLNPWMEKPKYEQNEYGMTFFYRYTAEDGVSMCVKIEVNTREHFSVLGHHQMNYRVASPWFEGEAPLTTLCEVSRFCPNTHRSKGCLSRDTAFIMVFKLIKDAEKTWRKLNGKNQLSTIISGVKFSDGLEVMINDEKSAA